MSVDNICPGEQDRVKTEDVYLIEFFNTIGASGLTNHPLRLKVGCPVMLSRNIDPSAKLCNGVHLIFTEFGEKNINSKTIWRRNILTTIYIRRKLLSPLDTTTNLC